MTDETMGDEYLLIVGQPIEHDLNMDSNSYRMITKRRKRSGVEQEGPRNVDLLQLPYLTYHILWT